MSSVKFITNIRSTPSSSLSVGTLELYNFVKLDLFAACESTLSTLVWTLPIYVVIEWLDKKVGKVIT